MDIAPWHPQIVHFVIALAFVGVGFRLLSLTGKLSWTSPAATLLLVGSALASVLAAKSGDQAHGPAERVPGARPAVVEHEEWGERARNMLLLIAGLELLGLVVRRPENVARGLRFGMAGAGLVGLFVVYEAAEHGGDLVYSFAGGVGTRSGAPEDLGRLLTAGLYHQAQRDRADGRLDEAERLLDELGRRHPGSVDIALLRVDFQLRDRKDPEGALARLGAITVPDQETRAVIRHGLLTAEALQATGQTDAARAVLQGLAGRFPENGAVQRALSGTTAPTP